MQGFEGKKNNAAQIFLLYLRDLPNAFSANQT